MFPSHRHQRSMLKYVPKTGGPGVFKYIKIRNGNVTTYTGVKEEQQFSKLLALVSIYLFCYKINHHQFMASGIRPCLVTCNYNICGPGGLPDIHLPFTCKMTVVVLSIQLILVEHNRNYNTNSKTPWLIKRNRLFYRFSMASILTGRLEG